MDDFKEILAKRFGEHRVSDYLAQEVEIELVKLDLELSSSPVTIILTNGLRNYAMPVPEKYKGQEHIELCFCLPSYWDLSATENSNMQWPLKWLDKLAKHLIEKETWYGPGHTFANGNPPQPFSHLMKPNHLLLVEPIKLEEHLSPLQTKEKTIHFLAIVPIYEQEFDIKMAKGFGKFLRKFRARNGNEIVDDYRENIYASRFRIF
jgi:hypothetical protein